MSSEPDQTLATWLGQSGFLLAGAGRRVLVDPFLSPHPRRLVAPLAAVTAILGDIDVLLITHEHVDHLDLPLLPLLAERSPGATLVVPDDLVPFVQSRTDLPVQGLLPGGCLSVNGVAITAVPALHPIDPDGQSDGCRALGYLTDLGTGVWIYHAGDTYVTDGIVTFLKARRVDVALLPINGRDYFRERDGVVGNMSAREAVGLAGAAGAALLVPMHWGMMAGNTESVGGFVDAAVAADARFHVLVPRLGVPIDLGCFGRGSAARPAELAAADGTDYGSERGIG